MKIISNFYDYYDKVAGTFYDPSIIYHRKTELFSPKLNIASEFSQSFNNRKEKEILDFLKNDYIDYLDIWKTRDYSYLKVQFGYLSLCEKIYPFIIPHYSFLKEACWDIPTIESLGNIKSSKYYSNSKKKTIQDFLSFNDKEFIRNLHFTYKSPALLFMKASNLHGNVLDICDLLVESTQKDILLTNPNLGLMNFNKVLDPYTVFQEISMYISGVLGQESMPIVEISDKDMAYKKGFGHKYAFRKEPKI